MARPMPLQRSRKAAATVAVQSAPHDDEPTAWRRAYPSPPTRPGRRGSPTVPLHPPPRAVALPRSVRLLVEVPDEASVHRVGLVAGGAPELDCRGLVSSDKGR